jgi:hypothetical protein
MPNIEMPVKNQLQGMLAVFLKPLLMAAIFGKLSTKNRQFQMLITFEPFIRFLQMKAQSSS